ncbi:MAG: hypothetical protein NTW54_12870 [Bacteroidetes bacterium]|nr:hypothetical protein [Bacteroidota bacterium]
MVFLIFIGCKRSGTKNSFYYWKSNYSNSLVEKTVFRENQISTLYLHFFDVVYNKELRRVNPVAIIKIQDTLPEVVIPVVYIENAAFQNTTLSDIDKLAEHVLNLIRLVADSNDITINELQFDCDWSGTTKEKYFHFLETTRKQWPGIKLSATIRLHQIKYKERTGIPPVNSAVIMLYNMGDLASFVETNSILNIEKARLYIDYLKSYTLPYQLALPLFSWGVVFRNEKLIYLNNEIVVDDLKDTSSFEPLSANRFLCKKGYFLHGNYLMQSDIIRYESSNYDNVNEMLQLAIASGSNQENDIILYYLDEKIINQFGTQNIQKLFKGN